MNPSSEVSRLGAASTSDPNPLWTRWQGLREEQPSLRARDAAARLGVSEAELSDCNPESHRLRGDWGAIIEGLRSVGPVMALTRNDGAVIEKTGPVEAVEIYPAHKMGQVVGTEVDLRLFLGHWAYGFAMTEETRSGRRISLQFFDARGRAVLKVYRVADTDGAAWEALVAAYGDAEPAPLTISEPAPPPATTPDAQIDVSGLRTGWLRMTNTHDFFGLLRRFKVERRQALRLAGSDLAQPAAADSYTRVLELARLRALELMIFVGNPGCLQIHTGAVARLVTAGQWFNVMDPSFNLHLWQPSLSEAWLVRKPTDQGVITSLECYNDTGELLLQFFGKRKGEAVESTQWRDVLGEATQARGFVGAAG